MRIIHKDITLIGALNPKLLEPEWLLDEGILTDKNIEGLLTMPMRTLAFESKERQVKWTADYNRLVIMPLSIAEEFGPNNLDFLPRIFEKLEHMPLDAVGYNIHAQIDAASFSPFEAGLNDLQSKLLPDKAETKEQGFQFRLEWESLTVLVKLERANQRIVRHVNFERKLQKGKGSSMISEFIKTMPECDKFSQELGL